MRMECNRTVLMVSLGNMVEWFDFALFIYLAPVIGKYFFPAQDPAYSTMMAFSVFAAGFICRPLGGILFGRMGDQIGRAKTLILSILAISCSTGLIGLLPSYTQIGWAAPVLLTVLRLIHGLSVGGEYTGAVIYLGESAPPHQRGFFASFAMVSANLGFFLATLIAMIGHERWRLCFICSGGLGFLILAYRFQLRETAAFIYLQNAQKIVRNPLLNALRDSPKQLLQILGLTGMGSTFYYLFFAYIPNSLTQSLNFQAVFLFIMIIFLPVAARCGDRFGRKKILLIAALGIMLFTIPCFYLIQQNTMISLLLGLSIATLLSALEQSNNLITFVESCPANTRYTCISFAYNAGNAIFGGTAPLVFSLLARKINFFASAYYLIAMATIGLIVILTLKRENQPSLTYSTLSEST